MTIPKACVKMDIKYSYFFFLLGDCVKADAATDFTSLDDLGLLNNLDALLATDFDVFSFFAIFLCI